MQAHANRSVGPLLLALIIATVGIPCVALLARWRREETRAFSLTFGACVAAGGLAQCYALATVGMPQDFGDAIEFFHAAESPAFVALSSEHSWAVLVWQAAHAGARALGLAVTPGLGATVNAAVMGLAGALCVSAARAVFGADPWRLRRVGTLVASSGLFLLFGALLLRDCFVVFFDMLWIWAVVRWLAKPGFLRLSVAAVVTAVAVLAMLSLRLEAVFLFAAYNALAALAWYGTGRLNGLRLAAIGLFILSLPVLGAYLRPSIDDLILAQSYGSVRYGDLSAAESSQSSLGMRFVVDQALPVRMVTGTGALLVGVIPLWAHFRVGATGYHWFKGYHALFQLAVIPLAAVGVLSLWRLWVSNGRRVIPMVFLAAWGFIGLLSVVATSLEQRHLSSFLISLIVLAALPDTRQPLDRRRWRVATAVWFTTIVAVHVAWAVARG